MSWKQVQGKPRAPRARLTVESLEQREMMTVTTISHFATSHKLVNASPPHTEIRSSAATRVSSQKYISNVLNEAIQRVGIPGMSAAVIVGGQVYVGAAGVRQAGNSTRVLPTDQFMLGSTTKSMTATLAGIMVDRGVIKWTTTLAEVFPELQGSMNPQYRSVTLEELLSHRSGISDESVTSDPTVTAAFQAAADRSPMAQRAAVVPAALAVAPGGPIGSFSYSNTGVTIAAAMLERLTHQSYEAMMRRYIFGPLGMHSAAFGPPGAIINGRPTQPVTRHQDGTPILPSSPEYAQIDPRIYDPAGTNLHMNVRDWSQYIRFQMGQRINGLRLLRPETLAKIHTSYPGPITENSSAVQDGYGYGWAQRPAGYGGRNPALGSSLWHDGSDNFWLAMVEAFPTKQFAVLLMSNSTLDNNGNDIENPTLMQIEQTLIDHFSPMTRP